MANQNKERDSGMPHNNPVFSRYKNGIKFFVETGSYAGDSIQEALNARFENIISIELGKNYYERCMKRFESHDNVKLVLGDSAFVLGEVIKPINERIIFWLDGHYSCSDTALGKTWSPLLEELKQIKNHPIKEHVILVDDMRLWKKEDLNIGFCEKEIKDLILEINSKYIITRENGAEKDDILVARIF